MQMLDVLKAPESLDPACGQPVEPSADMLRKGKWNPMKARSAQSQEAAETLAIQAFAFIAEEPDRLEAFLAASGIGPDAIRDAAREPDFLAGVLDHMLGDESLLLAFAARAGLDPASIARARRALGGSQWERDLP